MWRVWTWLGAVLLFLPACGGGATGPGGGSGPIADHVLSGQVNGMPWSFVAGETDAFLSTDHFFTNLYDMPFASRCAGRQPADTTRGVILQIPKLVGEYPLSLNLNATFFFDDGTGTYKNKVALQGRIDVKVLSSNELQGAARVYYDAANNVEGQFTVDICMAMP